MRDNKIKKLNSKSCDIDSLLLLTDDDGRIDFLTSTFLGDFEESVCFEMIDLRGAIDALAFDGVSGDCCGIGVDAVGIVEKKTSTLEVVDVDWKTSIRSRSASSFEAYVFHALQPASGWSRSLGPRKPAPDPTHSNVVPRWSVRVCALPTQTHALPMFSVPISQILLSLLPFDIPIEKVHRRNYPYEFNVLLIYLNDQQHSGHIRKSHITCFIHTLIILFLIVVVFNEAVFCQTIQVLDYTDPTPSFFYNKNPGELRCDSSFSIEILNDMPSIAVTASNPSLLNIQRSVSIIFSSDRSNLYFTIDFDFAQSLTSLDFFLGNATVQQNFSITNFQCIDPKQFWSAATVLPPKLSFFSGMYLLIEFPPDFKYYRLATSGGYTCRTNTMSLDCSVFQAFNIIYVNIPISTTADIPLTPNVTVEIFFKDISLFNRTIDSFYPWNSTDPVSVDYSIIPQNNSVITATNLMDSRVIAESTTFVVNNSPAVYNFNSFLLRIKDKNNTHTTYQFNFSPTSTPYLPIANGNISKLSIDYNLNFTSFIPDAIISGQFQNITQNITLLEITFQPVGNLLLYSLGVTFIYNPYSSFDFDLIQSTYNSNFTVEMPFSYNTYGNLLRIEWQSTVYKTWIIPLEQNVSLINVSKISCTYLSAFTYLLRVEVMNNVDAVKVKPGEVPLKESISFDGQKYIYEAVMLNSQKNPNNQIIVSSKNGFVEVLEGKPYNSNFDIFTPYQNLTYFALGENTIFRFEKNNIDLTNGPVDNVLIMSFVVNDPVLQPEMKLDSLIFKGYFDFSDNLYKIPFTIATCYPPGEIPFIINFPFINIISGEDYFTTPLIVNGDLIPPMITNVTASVQNLIVGADNNLTMAWRFRIVDAKGGFYNGTIQLVSSIDPYPITIPINTTHLVSGHQYDGVYIVFVSIDVFICQPQIFKLFNATLFDSTGINLYLLEGNNVDAFLPIYGTPMENQMQINVSCQTPNTLVPISSPPTLTVNRTTIDVFSNNRTVEFKLVVNDNIGFSFRHTPVILLTSPYSQPLSIQMKGFYYSINTAKYIVIYEIPYGYGSMEGIFISVYGVVNKLLSYSSYPTSKLAAWSQPYMIQRVSSSDLTPMIDTISSLSNLGGQIMILGNNFIPSNTQLLIDWKDGNGFMPVPIASISYSTIIAQIKQTSGNFNLKIKVNAAESNVITVNPIYTGPTPTPTSTGTPAPSNTSTLCRGTPPCNNRGTCTSTGCECKAPWTGPSCSSETIVIVPPTPQPEPQIGINVTDSNTDNIVHSNIKFLQVREIDDVGATVQRFDIKEWILKDKTNSSNPIFIYSTTLINTTTNINVTIMYFKDEATIKFGSQNLTMQPSSIKFTIEISHFEFTQKVNSLQVVMEASIKGSDKYSCSSVDFGSATGSKNDIQWIKMDIDKTSLYGRFITFGIVDNRETNIKNGIVDDNDKSGSEEITDSSQFRKVLFGITIPNYNESVLLDPDFSNILNTNDDKPTNTLCSSKSSQLLSTGAIIGIVVGAAALAFIIATIIFLKKKYKYNIKILQIKLKSTNQNR
ncbi:hypothetical protein PPL_02159 [Heterostelium album PN500]|uniref:EGF-like domain-containing protein n=1 Tax=Heterostelium pallidum (strain ATCC 26659 / Pp 5 / PN500) TaxID=670386 RepID=D3B1I5_HETP5|nr:hypothetical protein PPL_02159 [Heterostelium album PN500]EFA85159.1 hypothetical protein PPL_02159 [Heterostelium album PN500]|eukprot:XP_020437268.1 hypothetical protein PPL_02159 [Heterostelium album PN500]